MNILRSTAGEEYISQLRSVYRGVRLYDPSYALSQDRDIWEKLLRDPHLRHLIDHRARLVAGKEWRVVAGQEDDKHAQLLADVTRNAFDGIRNFTKSRQTLAMNGIFQGSGYSFIEAKTRSVSLARTTKMKWRLPKYLRQIGRSRFRFDPEWTEHPDGFDTVRSVVKLWPIDFGDAVELTHEDSMAIVRVAYDDDETRLGYGRGLWDAMYFGLFAKLHLMQAALDSADVYAHGLPIYKVDAEAHGSAGKTADQIAKDALAVIRKMGKEYGVSIDSRDDMEIKWPGGTGWQQIQGMIQMINDELTQLVLSSKLPTGGGGEVGSLSRAETEAGQMDALICSDREVLDDAYTHHLITWFLRHNHENLVSLGLDQATRPVFKTGDQVRTSPEEAQGNLRTAIELGADVDSTEFYDLLDLTPPKGVGPVIKGRSADQGGSTVEEDQTAKFAAQFAFNEGRINRERKGTEEGGRFAPTDTGTGEVDEDPRETGSRADVGLDKPIDLGPEDDSGVDGGEQEPVKTGPPDAREIVGALTKAKWGRFGTSKPPTKDPADAVPEGLTDRDIDVLGFMAQRNGLGTGAKDFPRGVKARDKHLRYWRAVVVELISKRAERRRSE